MKINMNKRTLTHLYFFKHSGTLRFQSWAVATGNFWQARSLASGRMADSSSGKLLLLVLELLAEQRITEPFPRPGETW
jgi:hypothetical protein